jgi:hypothetical protein
MKFLLRNVSRQHATTCDNTQQHVTRHDNTQQNTTTRDNTRQHTTTRDNDRIFSNPVTRCRAMYTIFVFCVNSPYRGTYVHKKRQIAGNIARCGKNEWQGSKHCHTCTYLHTWHSLVFWNGHNIDLGFEIKYYVFVEFQVVCRFQSCRTTNCRIMFKRQIVELCLNDKLSNCNIDYPNLA